MENIKAAVFHIGKNSFIHPSARICGINGEAEQVFIGDNVYIGERVQIICNNFRIGDYSKIHHDTNVHGYKPCNIGHNAWVGQYCIIDSIGGTTIGDNCGVGAHSQLWSHIKYGDTLEGCRFLDQRPLNIGNDVWFVGHCIVSPVTAHDKSMAMVGSVVTKNMNYNEIYAGSPAKSISEKIGFQFEEVSVETKRNKMLGYLEEFGNNKFIKIVEDDAEINFNDGISYFNVKTRKYKKTSSEAEIAFMHFLLPAKAKFTPC
jgi:acetyltransferase-like isoleucine patch superfamily enzyme